MKSVLLVYNVTDEAKKKLLSRIFGFLGFKLRAVEKKEYNIPLGVLTGIDTLDSEIAVYDEEGFTDEMLVIQSDKEASLDKALFLMKEEKIRIGLKAMVTPTNKEWTTIDLYKEISKDHEYMKNKQKERERED
ncbi:MAG: DUF3783 domain-containing protein [Suipraeoptans sp.]